MLLPCLLNAQTNVRFSGQASSLVHYHHNNDLPLWLGARYLPQLNVKLPLSSDNLIDFETSANINGMLGMYPFDTLWTDGRVKPYRVWARYSKNQLEVRLGLQKINFGSATMLRPLMWFDQMDPRDPLQLTDGVWGLLTRYYFLDNTNIWFWALYGNKDAKSWEIGNTSQSMPELGGRIQTPIPKGEAALSYHFRMANTRDFSPFLPAFERIPENRIGLDAKVDVGIGLWTEASLSFKSRDIGMLTNTGMLNLGVDYTFSLGNGLTVIAELLLAGSGSKVFQFENGLSFSALSLNYPISMFDNVSAMLYYDLKSNNTYNFLSWKRQYNKMSLYLMGFWNPDQFNLPQQQGAADLFSGKGIQFMMVFNH